MDIPIPVHFCCRGSLNDFLRKEVRDGWFVHTCPSTSTVKDGIEAVGIPHVEVAAVCINDAFATFAQTLQEGDRVEVYPLEEHPELPAGYSLHAPLPPKPGFILDVHLGKLARLMRMAGLDCLYEQDYEDEQIAKIAAAEKRVALTRDINLLKRKILPWGYWLRSQLPEEQFVEVLTRFRLIQRLSPFSRCMICNGCLQQVEKEMIVDQLEPMTSARFDQFYQCTSCQRIYWQGSHFERMEALIDHLRKTIRNDD